MTFDQILRENSTVAVWWHLMRSFMLIARHTERMLAQWGLSGPQYGVLRTIDLAGGSLSLSQISERMLVTCGNITGLVDRLERDGLVARERSHEDRRIVFAHITAEGRRLSEEAHTEFVGLIGRLLDFMGPEERKALAQQLEQLHLHLKEENPS